MDKIFGGYLIRTTVVSAGDGEYNYVGHWEVFKGNAAEERQPIARGVGGAKSDFDTAGTIAQAEAVLWIEQSEGRMIVTEYKDFD